MNRIIIDKENYIELDNNVFELDIRVKKLVLDIKGKVLINEINVKEDEILELDIKVNDKSSLVYNRFMIHNNSNVKINILQTNDSDIIFNYAFLAKDECHVDIESQLCGDNNKTEIKIRSVTTDKGKVIIKSSALVKENIKDNDLLESIKVLLLNDEESIVIPNLLVSSNEVIVNHAATLSSIDRNELQYLMGKGLSLNSAIKLIKNGYLISNLNINEDVKERIRDLLDGGE